MRVSLKQSEITQAIAVYLAHKGLSNVKAEDLSITYTRVLKGEHQGISAEFDVPDTEDGPVKEQVKASGAPLSSSEQAQLNAPLPPAPELPVSGGTEPEPGTTSSGGFVAPAEDEPAATVAQEVEQPAVDEVAQAQAEDAAADQAEGKSLFD